jgi:hypothetical protein
MNKRFSLRASPLVETILPWRGTEQRLKARKAWTEAEYAEEVKRYVKVTDRLRIELLGSDACEAKESDTYVALETRKKKTDISLTRTERHANRWEIKDTTGLSHRIIEPRIRDG